MGENGKWTPAEFCVVSLGKLGSKELNYSSDIDLLFLYSADGETAGGGQRTSITNREFFVKLSETLIKLVGRQTGEGAAYRVDLRLRPNGRVGALAVTLADAVRYYETEAAAWERQVLIRSRSSAGHDELFKRFFRGVRKTVFAKGVSVDEALANVRLSKEKIDKQHALDRGFDVKLGRGGIREIEFLAQALQLAYGGNDPWLRFPHTLVMLARLSERKLISKRELTQLSTAYDFLRRLEHALQMENGLQTHAVPLDDNRRLFAGKCIGFSKLADLRQGDRAAFGQRPTCLRTHFWDGRNAVAAAGTRRAFPEHDLGNATSRTCLGQSPTLYLPNSAGAH